MKYGHINFEQSRAFRQAQTTRLTDPKLRLVEIRILHYCLIQRGVFCSSDDDMLPHQGAKAFKQISITPQTLDAVYVLREIVVVVLLAFVLSGVRMIVDEP